ncbi:MAG: methyltransferase domain-containing protein [Candidatus Nomurabacteria bacterium]|nr:methyltransferase domain-containing protein [Candidatus Nomurabacteria bacterium]
MIPKITNIIRFIRETIKHPQQNGAIAPSSKKLAILITQKAELDNAKVIVEIGSGDGVFTKEIFKKINNKVPYFAIEINKFFVDQFKKTYPNLTIYHDSAQNIDKCLVKSGHTKCDRVISGLPWTAFDEKMQKDIITKIYNSLEEGGLFVTFSYYPLNNLPDGKAFHKTLNSLFKSVNKSEVVLNFPPAFVYICRK